MTWETLWAYGRYDLGLSEAEFWSLTPREFSLLADRDVLHVRWHDMRSALAPFVMNCLWSKGKAKLEDFLVRSGADGVVKVEDPDPVAVQDKVHSSMMALMHGMKGK